MSLNVSLSFFLSFSCTLFFYRLHFVLPIRILSHSPVFMLCIKCVRVPSLSPCCFLPPKPVVVLCFGSRCRTSDVSRKRQLIAFVLISAMNKWNTIIVRFIKGIRRYATKGKLSSNELTTDTSLTYKSSLC